ncbi:MAG: FAD-dependent monooxygenase [Betaproteobacteria bacterium]|nr:FAD-dependent monooxygenase [Betaproteobacteria bacterium]
MISPAKHSEDIIVVGAGINGLAMALGLALQNVSVTVIDSASSPIKEERQDQYDSRIYALNDNSITLLKRLGVWSLCNQQRIQPITAMKVYGDTNGQLDFSVTEGTDHKEALGVIVESRQILHALYQLTSQHPRITFLLDTTIKATDLINGMRRVTLHDNRQLFTPLLIASDGVHSSTRALLGIQDEITYYQHSAVVANYQSDRDHFGVAKQWFLPDGDILALLPLPDKKLSMVWSTQHVTANELHNAQVQDRIKSIVHQVGYSIGNLTEITEPRVFPLQLVKVKPIILERFMLCGDAAHGVHPMAGQGLNLGLADVSTFMELLSRQNSSLLDVGNATVLHSYARRRNESIVLMQYLTHYLYIGFNLNHPWATQMRNFGMNLINHLPGIKQRLLKQAGHA